jgi:hypothetical protein
MAVVEGGAEGFDEHGWDDAQELPKEEQDALQKEIEHAMRAVRPRPRSVALAKVTSRQRWASYCVRRSTGSYCAA